MIKSITQKVSVRFAAGAVGVAMLVSGLGLALPAAAAGLTSSQVSSILSLLQSFGADQATINNVNAALTGQTTTTTTTTTGSMSGSCSTTFTANLTVGSTGAQVMALQKFLNQDPDTMVASTGAGSPGNESSYFGPATKAAVIKFQQKYAAQVLTPVGLSLATGYWGASSRAEANSLCGGSTTTTTTSGGTTTTGTAAGTAVVSAAAQPANSIAPQGASRVPYTTFTVTANGAPVTVNSVSVVRQGPSVDTDFSGVVLINQSTGVQLGTSRVLDANHSAVIGTAVTIPAGTSVTFEVAGDIAASGAGSGDVASFAVTAVNTASTVSGSFPIIGASNTINSNLVIGNATISTSSFDPNTAGTQPVGTTGYRFTGIRIQAGSVEDITLHSITWYQSGSASGLQNVMTYINGTSYPTVVDSTGKYYTSVFPSGIVIPKGQQDDVYVQGDLGANTTANTYAEFDIYRSTDIYVTGNTYGFGITPTASAVGGTCNGASDTTPTYCAASSHTTLIIGGTNTPWIQGSTLQVTAGQFSTIQNATSVGAQNIAVNVPNQPLGGFMTNLTGEAIQVQSLKIHLTTSVAMAPIQNVSLVDQNGNVVAGPYNATCNTSEIGGAGTVCTGADTNQSVTFTGATTFPSGSYTYTLEGQLPSGTANGDTVQANTTPSTDWTSVTGATTGNTISINVGQVTLNTMTVQGATLAVSNGTTPTSQAIVAGGSNVQFATIQLDASQSGEDVRLSSLPMTLTTTDTVSKLSNCQVWNGSTALNTGSYVVNGSNLSSTSPVTTTFQFNNSLTIPKGTVLTLSLTCSLASNAIPNATYSWAGSALTATGVTSGSSINVASIGGSAPSMTVSTGASLAITTDPSSPSYSLVAGPSTGVTMSVIKFHATNEAVNLQKVGLQLTNGAASSSPSDVTQAYIYAGNNVDTTAGVAIAPNTLLGTLVFTGSNYTGTSTLSTVVQLPVNTDATLIVKADIAAIGTNQPGHEGHKVAIDYLNSQGTGANSGSTVNASVANGNFTGSFSAGVRTFKTTPVVAAGPAVNTSPNGTGQALKKFSITAGTQGGIGLNTLTVNIATSTGVTLNNVKIFAYTDSGYSQPANVPGTSGGLFGASQPTVASGSSVVFSQSANSNAPLEIGAGQTVYFTVSGDVTVSGVSTWSVNATLQGDSAYPSLPTPMGQVGQLSGSNFIWSPNATTTVTATGEDWTNGYSVSGLPSTGL